MPLYLKHDQVTFRLFRNVWRTQPLMIKALVRVLLGRGTCGSVTMSEVSTLSRSPRPMLVMDSEDSRWRSRQKGLLRCERFFFFLVWPYSDIQFILSSLLNTVSLSP